MNSFYESVIGTITKSPDYRSDEEINAILTWFLNLFRKKPIFNDISEVIVKDLIKNCSFESKQKDELIIRQGDLGDRFYINLRGNVSIYINQIEHENDFDYSLNHEADIEFNLQMSLVDEEDEEVNRENEDQKSKRKREMLGSYVTSLSVGEGFGEMALVCNDRRSASVIADETTDLMVINRALYARCLEAPTLKSLKEKQDFIDKSPFFGHWSLKMKKLLSLCLERKQAPVDSYLGKQNEPANRVYFIKSGLAKLVVDSTLHEMQYPKLYPLNFEKKEDEASTAICELRRHFRPKKIEIGILGTGEILGLCEILLDLPTYMQSALCMQECDVFFMYKQNYERLVVGKQFACLNRMRDYVYMKLTNRNQRLKFSYRIDLFLSFEDKLQQKLIALNKSAKSIDHILSKKKEVKARFVNKAHRNQENVIETKKKTIIKISNNEALDLSKRHLHHESSVQNDSFKQDPNNISELVSIHIAKNVPFIDLINVSLPINRMKETNLFKKSQHYCSNFINMLCKSENKKDNKDVKKHKYTKEEYLALRKELKVKSKKFILSSPFSLH